MIFKMAAVRDFEFWKFAMLFIQPSLWSDFASSHQMSRQTRQAVAEL